MGREGHREVPQRVQSPSWVGRTCVLLCGCSCTADFKTLEEGMLSVFTKKMIGIGGDRCLL